MLDIKIPNKKVDFKNGVFYIVPDSHVVNHNLFCKNCQKILTLSSFDSDFYRKYEICESCAIQQIKLQ